MLWAAVPRGYRIPVTAKQTRCRCTARRGIRSVCVSSWCMILISAGFHATLAESNVRFSGEASADFQYDHVHFPSQGRPEWISTLTVNPRLMINGQSLSLLVKVSSLDKSDLQPFNRLGLHAANKWAKLRLGDSNPVYSQYSVNGVLVRGASLDLHPGLFRASACYGESKRAVEGGAGVSPTYRQRLFGAKLGVGSEQQSHLHLNYVRAKDEEGSLSQDSTQKPAPKACTAVSLSGGLHLIQSKLIVEGEIAGSHLVRDTRSARLDNEEVPKWIARIARPRISSQFGLAARVRSAITVYETRLEATYSRIEPGFSTLGTAYLQTDIQRTEVSAGRRFWRNQIWFDGRYAYSRDNLGDLKQSTTRANSGGVTLGFMPQGLPSLVLSVLPYCERNTLIGRRLTDTYSASSSHAFTLWNLSHTASASYSQSRYRDRTTTVYDSTEISGASNDYTIHNLLLSATTTLRIPLAISYGVGFTRNRRTSGTDADLWSYDLGLSCPFARRKLTAQLSASVLDESGGALSDKLALRANARYDLQPIGEVTVSLERIAYSSRANPETGYDEFISRLTLIRRW
jgi:hypothetical protein